jgi:hypothetical protein
MKTASVNVSPKIKIMKNKLLILGMFYGFCIPSSAKISTNQNPVCATTNFLNFDLMKTAISETCSIQYRPIKRKFRLRRIVPKCPGF